MKYIFNFTFEFNILHNKTLLNTEEVYNKSIMTGFKY